MYPLTIPISIHPLFWVVAVLLGWNFSNDLALTAIWVAIIFFSVLLHELGHALTARFFGQKASIELVAFGGLTSRAGGRLKLWQDFIIVFSGPLAGFFLFIMLHTIFRSLPADANPFLRYAIGNGGRINLFWTLLNLLPIMPLDGGQLMKIILESIFGLRGVKISLFISCALGVLAGLFFFLNGSVLIGMALFIVSFDSFRGWQSILSVTDKDQDKALQKMLREANKHLEKGHTAEAEAILKQLRNRAVSGAIYDMATELLARIALEENNYEDTYRLLRLIRSPLSELGMRMLHQVTYSTKRWQEAIKAGKASYQNAPSADTAILNGLCHAALGETEAAIGWLERAQEEGATGMAVILTNKELDPIRNDPQFEAFARRINCRS